MRPLRSDPCPTKTRSDLEWDRVLEALAERCASAPGRQLALALPFAESRDEARTRLAEAREAVRAREAGRPLPVVELGDVREAIERARVGGVLSPVELQAIGRLTEVARGLRRSLSSRKGELPLLFAALSTDPTLDDLGDLVAASFDDTGALADRASPRLAELRAEWQAARQRMVSRMEDLMNRYEPILQDRFVTEREGRWVLPVRSDAHERFPGIVHATSASGATLFVEPRSVIPMGNRLKVLDAEVRREEQAVYAHLTTKVADALTSVEAALAALALADVRAATARLAEDLGLSFAELTDEARIELEAARHPLLALDLIAADRSAGLRIPPLSSASRIVPSDVAAVFGRAVVVSGPNAGGKTVALKTLGLAALMARSGLPVPCDEASTVGLFDVVLTDVGDDQSLGKSLSTFSAHVANLAQVLSETANGALVLLDELAGGTDPREGEALAAGVLDCLCARGGAVVVTTHYEGLKALALVDDRFENASVGFDLATMSPTFELHLGVAGSSSALAVARRFGMPAAVIDRAERFLTREERHFEAVVTKLNEERAALVLARASAEDREREAALAKRRLDAELEAARHRERRALSEEARDLAERLRRAREDLRDAQARLRSKKPDALGIREVERVVERIGGDLAVGGALEPLIADIDNGEREPVRSLDLKPGARVWVPRLRAEAEVLSVSPDGQVRVAAGALKLTLPAGDLRVPSSSDPPAIRPASRSAAPREPATDAAPPIQVRDNTCDLRGLRVDDALGMAMTFLDRALNDGRSVVFFQHGHGTGALRDALRKELARSPYVARFRPGGPEGGGESTTVVWLA